MKTRFEMNGVLFIPLCNLTPDLREVLEINGYQIIKIESGADNSEDLR